MSPPPRDLLPLPRTVALALWSAAYVRGDAAPDDALDRARGLGHRHVEQLGVDLLAWLNRVRALPILSLRPVLPAPGRVAGLLGPPGAISAAIEAGQALVVTAAGFAEHTLVPATEVIGSAGAEGIVIRWAEIEAPHRPVPPPGAATGARPAFLAALRRAADSTIGLDLVPDEPIATAYLPDDWTLTVPPAHVADAQAHLLRLAARTLLLTRAELDALTGPLADRQTGAVSLTQETARADLLGELHDAARQAVVEVAEATSAV